MGKKCFELEPRDVLFFRDGRPMDVDKDREDVFNVGHGANWPRPDQLFSAVIHELLRNPNAPEREWYGKVTDLHVAGPFPKLDGEVYLPMPLDWDMSLIRFDDAIGVTDVAKPLRAGFADRVVEKKSYPRWIGLREYQHYLNGDVGNRKRVNEPDEPKNADARLYGVEPRACTTLDAATGASRRIQGRHESGQYEAEYLRLCDGVRMICEIETEKAESLAGRMVRFGGQGGMVRFSEAGGSLSGLLESLSHGTPSRFVRWTLLTPAMFVGGWYPNWLEKSKDGTGTGKVMIPMNKVLRRPGESRASYRARMKEECQPFDTATLIAACIGKVVAFSGYDSCGYEKPTELAVPAGSSYVFECATLEEAAKLIDALNLKSLSDLGEKGFGLGLCSYVPEPAEFKI